ncbi:MAG: flagellar hook-basal body complex protein FliE [Acidobacteria bacterium]|nr:flagellar hook-basal body complex protein FliE [Acidobacteriota bacterium]MBI3657840.1 flagellar hook-basal body complex protein FliE [Acidobacteriota bacterium]
MNEILIGKLSQNIPTPRPMRPDPGLGPTGKGGPAFGQVLKDAIMEVNQVQKQSDEEIHKLMTGEVNDVHTALIAVQKADMSFQMMMQIRNKIVQAYQEIMRMQL